MSFLCLSQFSHYIIHLSTLVIVVWFGYIWVIMMIVCLSDGIHIRFLIDRFYWFCWNQCSSASSIKICSLVTKCCDSEVRPHRHCWILLASRHFHLVMMQHVDVHSTWCYSAKMQLMCCCHVSAHFPLEGIYGGRLWVAESRTGMVTGFCFSCSQKQQSMWNISRGWQRPH